MTHHNGSFDRICTVLITLSLLWSSPFSCLILEWPFFTHFPLSIYDISFSMELKFSLYFVDDHFYHPRLIAANAVNQTCRLRFPWECWKRENTLFKVLKIWPLHWLLDQYIKIVTERLIFKSIWAWDWLILLVLVKSSSSLWSWSLVCSSKIWNWSSLI